MEFGTNVPTPADFVEIPIRDLLWMVDIKEEYPVSIKIELDIIRERVLWCCAKPGMMQRDETVPPPCTPKVQIKLDLHVHNAIL